MTKHTITRPSKRIMELLDLDKSKQEAEINWQNYLELLKEELEEPRKPFYTRVITELPIKQKREDGATN